MARNIKQDRKAISPVISTIIIVAIAIAIAIAVAYWMVGITGGFTRFEKLDVTTIYADAWTNNTSGYNITLSMKNSGQVAITFDRILINGKPAVTTDGTTGAYGANVVAELVSGGTSWNSTLNPGESRTIRILCNSSASSTFSSGVSIEVALMTRSGNSYPKSVTLP
ncbi:MAG: archaellin/type IV pilin N-terminal domain-containing protein [Candidatus Bathyarchaeia archaeon]